MCWWTLLDEEAKKSDKFALCPTWNEKCYIWKTEEIFLSCFLGSYPPIQFAAAEVSKDTFFKCALTKLKNKDILNGHLHREMTLSVYALFHI